MPRKLLCCLCFFLLAQVCIKSHWSCRFRWRGKAGGYPILQKSAHSRGCVLLPERGELRAKPTVRVCRAGPLTAPGRCSLLVGQPVWRAPDQNQLTRARLQSEQCRVMQLITSAPSSRCLWWGKLGLIQPQKCSTFLGFVFLLWFIPHCVI